MPLRRLYSKNAKMIGILLPVSALGLMLQRPLNTLNTKPLSATGPGTRAVVPLRMGGKGFFEKAEDKFEGFVENVEDKIEGFVEGVEDKIEGFVEGVDDKITEAAEDKINKEAIENQIKALVANTGEDSEHKSAGWGGEGSGPDKERILAAVETIVAGRREEVAGGVTNRQLEILKILKFFNLPVIADELIQVIEALLQAGREGVTVPVGSASVVVTTDPLSSLWAVGAARRPNPAPTLFRALRHLNPHSHPISRR